MPNPSYATITCIAGDHGLRWYVCPYVTFEALPDCRKGSMRIEKPVEVVQFGTCVIE